MHKSILQDVKLYMAFDSEDHYIMANKAEASGNNQWFCTDCRCPLKLCNDITGEEDWFEHAPDDETTKALVMGCGHLLAAIKKRVFMMRLRKMINELDTLVATRHWFCVWCQSHYQGEKHCKTCKTGIYSISRGDWIWNYSQKEKLPNSDINDAIDEQPHQTDCESF
ncbi:putative zinc ribbon protein [Photorhabdus temperata subsp. temperata]